MTKEAKKPATEAAEKQEKRTLAQKLLELQKSVVKLSKNEKGYDYKFVSGSKLLSFIRPAMDELGLLLLPNTISVDQQIVKTLEAIPASGNYKGRPEKYEVLVTLTKTFTWVDTDSGETLKTTFIAQGCNGWDKAIGSAETYAERYFLLKFFHIATDDDDVDKVNAIRSSQDDDDNKNAKKAAPAQEGQPKAKKVADLTEKAYNAWVEFAAMGKNTQDGLPARDGFINKFRPNEKELEDFDKAVFRFQLDNGINPEENTKQASLNL